MRHSHDQDRDEFTSFVSRILRRAEVTMSVILGALVYIERAKPHLRIAIEGKQANLRRTSSRFAAETTESN